MEEQNQSQTPILLLVDSYALLHRAYHAIPSLTSPTGEPTNAIYGFFRILFKAVRHFEPAYLVPAFDLPGPTFRHEKYSEYKAKRVKQEASFYVQIDKVKNILQKVGIKYFEKAGFEADDIIGTVSRLATEADKNLKVIILTGDLDTLQLVDDRVFVYTFHQGIKNEVLYDASKIEERFNLTPSQLIDYKSLRGDPSDNILGVKGIGEKGAIRLLNLYPTLENLYAAVEDGTAAKTLTTTKDKNLIAKLKTQKDQAYFSKCLVTIDRQTPIDFSLEAVTFKGFDYEAFIPPFQELGFSSLVSKAKAGLLDSQEEPSTPKAKTKTVINSAKILPPRRVSPPTLF